jgi:hypothetical protein
MTIKIGQKWIATSDNYLFDNKGGIEYQIYEGTIITIIDMIGVVGHPYITNFMDMRIGLSYKEVINNFILLAEWRDKQINSILNDN